MIEPADNIQQETSKAGRKEWIGLVVIALPCLLYSMDLTVLNLAIPTISEELKPSGTELLWIIDIYGFMVAGMLITMGTLGDRIGRRKLLLIGAAAFGVASVFAASVRSAELLILSRAVLGVAGATVAPSTLSLIRNMFHDEKQRTFAIGMWITAYSVGGAIGPLVGGLLLQYFHWSSIFLANVPVMLLLLAVGPKFLPEFKNPNAGRLDFASALLSLAAILSVILGFKLTAEQGINLTASTFVVTGLILGWLFIKRQRKLKDPLIDLNLFKRSSSFGLLLSMNTLSIFTTFGCYIFISQYLQLVLGLSPLVAGLWTLPWSLGFIVGSVVTPKIANHFKKTTIMAFGLLLAALGFVVLARVSSLGLTAIVGSSILFSFGLAPLFTLITDMILSAVPPERAGTAGALSETSSELGGALGIAVLGSIGAAIYKLRMTSDLPLGLSGEDRENAVSTIGGAMAVSAKLPRDIGTSLKEVAEYSFIHSIETMAIISSAMCVLLALTVLYVFRKATR
ncbi:MAG TPA: MFS transporter [Chryseolinea sp.]|nr:MFS transporter [Chryseolinea sp.]